MFRSSEFTVAYFGTSGFDLGASVPGLRPFGVGGFAIQGP